MVLCRLSNERPRDLLHIERMAIKDTTKIAFRLNFGRKSAICILRVPSLCNLQLMESARSQKMRA